MPADNFPALSPGAGPDPATPEGTTGGPVANPPGSLPNVKAMPRPTGDHEPATEDKIGLGDEDSGISLIPGNRTEKEE